MVLLFFIIKKLFYKNILYVYILKINYNINYHFYENARKFRLISMFITDIFVIIFSYCLTLSLHNRILVVGTNSRNCKCWNIMRNYFREELRRCLHHSTAILKSHEFRLRFHDKCRDA